MTYESPYPVSGSMVPMGVVRSHENVPQSRSFASDEAMLNVIVLMAYVSEATTMKLR